MKVNPLVARLVIYVVDPKLTHFPTLPVSTDSECYGCPLQGNSSKFHIRLIKL